MGVDDALLAEPTAAGEEGTPSTEELLVQVRDELKGLRADLAALRPAPADHHEVDGR